MLVWIIRILWSTTSMENLAVISETSSSTKWAKISINKWKIEFIDLLAHLAHLPSFPYWKPHKTCSCNGSVPLNILPRTCI